VLSDAGWVITRGDTTQLRARRGDLVFSLTRGHHGEVGIGIKLTPSAAKRLLAEVP
jgi:hypothetical protein